MPSPVRPPLPGLLRLLLATLLLAGGGVRPPPALAQPTLPHCEFLLAAAAHSLQQ